MSVPEHFQRIDGTVDVERLQRATVVVIGVGAVGSRVAEELARSGVGRLVLVDPKPLEPAHLIRHVLGAEDLGENKAKATALQLTRRVPGLRAEHVARSTREMSNIELDRILGRADVVVAATDSRAVQRHVNRRALEVDVPAIFPGVDAAAERGEVFVSLGRWRTPCFGCWDRFRDARRRLRAVRALAVDVLPTVHVTVRACLAVLDPSSRFTELLVGSEYDPRLRTLFFVGSFGVEGDIVGRARGYRRAVPEFRPLCQDCDRTGSGGWVGFNRSAHGWRQRPQEERPFQTPFAPPYQSVEPVPTREPPRDWSGLAWVSVLIGLVLWSNLVREDPITCTEQRIRATVEQAWALDGRIVAALNKYTESGLRPPDDLGREAKRLDRDLDRLAAGNTSLAGARLLYAHENLISFDAELLEATQEDDGFTYGRLVNARNAAARQAEGIRVSGRLCKKLSGGVD